MLTTRRNHAFRSMHPASQENSTTATPTGKKRLTGQRKKDFPAPPTSIISVKLRQNLTHFNTQSPTDTSSAVSIDPRPWMGQRLGSKIDPSYYGKVSEKNILENVTHLNQDLTENELGNWKFRACPS